MPKADDRKRPGALFVDFRSEEVRTKLDDLVEADRVGGRKGSAADVLSRLIVAAHKKLAKSAKTPD